MFLNNVSEYTLNRHSHLINTELVGMLLATASVAQLLEHRTRFAGPQIRFPGGRPKVAFFATAPDWVLKVEVAGHSSSPSFVHL